MASPTDEVQTIDFPEINQQRSSEDDSTVGDETYRTDNTDRVSKKMTRETQQSRGDPLRSLNSPSRSREQATRIMDQMNLARIEQQISRQAEEQEEVEHGHNPEKMISYETRTENKISLNRERTRRTDNIDEFDTNTTAVHEITAVYRPPANPSTGLSKFMKAVHHSSFIIRYVVYIAPPTLIILIPLLIGALLPKARDSSANVGGVSLYWFCIWLEIVWLTLWLGRLIAKCLPWPVGLVASLFTDDSKKWRDMAKQLELAATVFFWWLGIEISFLPTMIHHHVDGNTTTKSWEVSMNKVLVSFFIMATLNLIEKIIIQLIAISFHMRTYADRIEVNRFQIGSLVKLYSYSKRKLTLEDHEFEEPHMEGPGSGAATPGAMLEKAQAGTKKAFRQFGDVAGKVAGDFTGKKVVQSSHPSQVILTLLHTTSGSQLLARRLYRTFKSEEQDEDGETEGRIKPESLAPAFDNFEEADAAFTMFDKDLNGDIEMAEFENVCVEIGRERKAITASLKDLDSVVSKLDDCFMFIVVVVTILVLISLLSTAAAGVLTSAGSAVLALSWLFSATAQEFLQSVIFVFVKHPFDVGDRVTIYGNTGATLKGDDYFVKEISLLYTEFKKMEGHVVQAPNSYLNTLFILNMRRSGGLAEAIPITFKYGTTLEQIDGLRSRLEAFVRDEKREYQSKILTEVRDVFEAHAISLNIVFFYKSNWQNEGLRLQRRNKFFCALMIAMQELDIEGPRMRYPGQKESSPMYLQQLPPGTDARGYGGATDNPNGLQPIDEGKEPSDTSSTEEARTRLIDTSGRAPSRVARGQSIAQRNRGESLAQLSRRIDFSLGMEAIASGDTSGDVYDDRESKVPRIVTSRSPSASRPRDSNDRQPSRNSATRPAANTFEGLHPPTRASTFAGSFMRRNPTEARRSISSVHRNRFFGRNSQEAERALESGMMEGIPEGGSTPETIGGQQRLDPRTGLVSPSAMRRSDELDFGRINTQNSSIGPETRNGRSLFQTPQVPPVTAPPPAVTASSQLDKNIEMAHLPGPSHQ